MAAAARRPRTGRTTGGSRAIPRWCSLPPCRRTSESDLTKSAGAEAYPIMADLVRVMPHLELTDPDSDPHLRQEWLVTNGLGGYASGTVSGTITRRYHGLLVAALPNPLGRMMMLNGLSERLRLPDRRVFYNGAQELAAVTPENTLDLTEFRLEAGLPVWRYDVEGFTLEKRLLMPYGQNTIHITYRLLSGKGTLRLGLRPAIRFRPHDAPVSAPERYNYQLMVREDQF